MKTPKSKRNQGYPVALQVAQNISTTFSETFLLQFLQVCIFSCATCDDISTDTNKSLRIWRNPPQLSSKINKQKNFNIILIF